MQVRQVAGQSVECSNRIEQLGELLAAGGAAQTIDRNRIVFLDQVEAVAMGVKRDAFKAVVAQAEAALA